MPLAGGQPTQNLGVQLTKRGVGAYYAHNISACPLKCEHVTITLEWKQSLNRRQTEC